ncbi:MAG TPA: AmmeMemoRadiSam system protein A [Deltaproteobacteria bacterium]|nr:AmmeMemoRadiSam system protein A [Deltaproteobacteria bacterium]
MSDLTDIDRNFLLVLARTTIEAKLRSQDPVDKSEEISSPLQEKRGCFVTLHKRGVLRGCIGTIEPHKSLLKGVEENAINAAFGDPRFPPMTEDELEDIEVEVSVLTMPRVLEYKDADDLKAKLRPGVHGVILSRGWQRSTFLPQVWEQLPNVEDFLGHLCNKAGMERRCWTDTNTVVSVYEAEYFSEKR